MLYAYRIGYGMGREEVGGCPVEAVEVAEAIL